MNSSSRIMGISQFNLQRKFLNFVFVILLNNNPLLTRSLVRKYKLNVSKAFNIVNHELLLHKMTHDNVYNWTCKLCFLSHWPAAEVCHKWFVFSISSNNTRRMWYDFLGVWTMTNHVWGSKRPKNWKFWDPNRHFNSQAKILNDESTISSQRQNTFSWNFSKTVQILLSIGHNW